MAIDVNVVVLIGRLTKDSEYKAFPSGGGVLRFSIAVNRRKKDGESWVDDVGYFDISLLGRSAETLRPYLIKGKQVSVYGELRQDRWEQDGSTKSRIYVQATTVQLLGSNSTDSTFENGSSVKTKSADYPDNIDMGPERFDDYSEVPF